MDHSHHPVPSGLKDTTLLKTGGLVCGQRLVGDESFDVNVPATGAVLAHVANARANKLCNAGQSFVCANRIYVKRGVCREFCAKFARKVGGLNVGNGLEAGVTQGRLIEPAAMDKVPRHLADALDKRAEALTGGQPLNRQFFQPTVMADSMHFGVDDYAEIKYACMGGILG